MDIPQIHVLSYAGKPIFSTTSNESSNASITGLIQGISSFSNDELRQITTSSHIITFLPKKSLLFFCITSNEYQGLNVNRLLELLMNHLLFFLTNNGLELMERNPTYDLRNLLYGTDGVFNAMLQAWLQHSWTQLNHIGIRFWPMKLHQRRTIENAMEDPGLVFGLILMQGYLVAYKQGHKNHPFLVEDVHILSNILGNMPSFKTSESWTPLCLPTFNSSGYLYGYIVYLTPQLCVLLLSTNQSADQFHAFQTRTRTILAPLLQSIIDSNTPMSCLPRRFQPLLLHFIYQSQRTHECITPDFQECTLLDSASWRIQVLRHYHILHQRLHRPTTELRKLGHPYPTESLATMYFARTETMVVLGIVKSHGYLYVCCQPLLTADQAAELAEALWRRIEFEMLQEF